MNKFSSHNILNLVISYHWSGSVKIDDLLIKVFYDNFDEFDIDEACLKYSDRDSSHLKRLINAIESLNEENLFKKIHVEEKYDGYYVEKISNDELVSQKYKEVCHVIDQIELQTNKGKLFEDFCKIFVSDLGINTKVTRASNDKGIDVVGNYKVDFPKNITKLIFSDDIYLLIQTKFYNKPIDTPVIRKLVGDSLFIRFDDLDYVDIRHNAFHLIVFSHKGFTLPARNFAKKNKIMIFDSMQIAHIISEDPKNDWKCLQLFKNIENID